MDAEEGLGCRGGRRRHAARRLHSGHAGRAGHARSARHDGPNWHGGALGRQAAAARGAEAADEGDDPRVIGPVVAPGDHGKFRARARRAAPLWAVAVRPRVLCAAPAVRLLRSAPDRAAPPPDRASTSATPNVVACCRCTTTRGRLCRTKSLRRRWTRLMSSRPTSRRPSGSPPSCRSTLGSAPTRLWLNSEPPSSTEVWPSGSRQTENVGKSWPDCCPRG
eukprot:scaffold11920_cov108-Isochrysis_galbana.AAC.1